MYDFISMSKASLLESEALTIIKHLDLNAVCAYNSEFYDNETTKNTPRFGGIYIRVTFKPLLKIEIEGSIHKYWYKKTNGYLSNYGLFTVRDAHEALKNMLKDIGISMDDLIITSYEIGLNLWLSNNCLNYTNQMQSKTIGTGNKARDFGENKGIKDKREQITLFHKDTRKYYKAYDKQSQMKEDRRADRPEHANILRIESVLRRTKLPILDFLSEKQAKKDCEQFRKDWNTLQFDRQMITPKGTNIQDIGFCTEILNTSLEQFNAKTKADFKSGTISERQKRTRNTFAHIKWGDLKSNILHTKSKEEIEFKAALENNYILAKL